MSVVVDAWFPKINATGEIASGSNGIWLTDANGKSDLISSRGTSPFWINGKTLCFNLNDGRTQIGNHIIEKAYNEYYGSEISRWTGFTAGEISKVDFYDGVNIYNHAENITLAKYSGYGSVYGFNLVYASPYQSEPSLVRSLIYNNVLIAYDKILNYAVSLNGTIVWQTATSTYGRQLHNGAGIISIRNDESPVAVVDYLGQSWMVSQTQIGILVYPIGSYMGYFLPGDLYNPDARAFFDYILIAGSSGSGEPKFNNRIYPSAPRMDLRNL